MDVRNYKGHQIHRQYVGPCGWNVTDENGKILKTGLPTLRDAKEFITLRVEDDEE